MDQEKLEFFKIVDGFRKVNLFAMIPDVSQSDYAVLKAIFSKLAGEGREQVPYVKVSVIVQELGCHAPIVSRSLKSLESRGLVVREPDLEDRRNTFVTITGEGKVLVKKVDAILGGFAENVFSRMEEEEIKEFNRLLLKFQTIVQEELEARKGV